MRLRAPLAMKPEKPSPLLPLTLALSHPGEGILGIITVSPLHSLLIIRPSSFLTFHSSLSDYARCASCNRALMILAIFKKILALMRG